MTTEGPGQAGEAQASATGTTARRSAASSFGDFGVRSAMGANRAFGAAGGYLADRTPGLAGTTGFALGATDAARELGALDPARVGRDIHHPAKAPALRAHAPTPANPNIPEKTPPRNL